MEDATPGSAETTRGLANKMKEHRADVRHHRTSSALVNHIGKVRNLPDWNGTRVLHYGLCSNKRKVLETLYISRNRNINKRLGDVVRESPMARFWAPKFTGG